MTHYLAQSLLKIFEFNNFVVELHDLAKLGFFSSNFDGKNNRLLHDRSNLYLGEVV